MGSYALRFRNLTAASSWNETTLLTAFRQELNRDIRQFMIVYDDGIGLETFIQKAIQVSQRYSACVTSSPIWQLPPPATPVAPPAPEPLCIDSYHLTPAEHQQRLLNCLCLYCRGEGHQITTCPVRPSRPVVSMIQVCPKTPHLV